MSKVPKRYRKQLKRAKAKINMVGKTSGRVDIRNPPPRLQTLIFHASNNPSKLDLNGGKELFVRQVTKIANNAGYTIKPEHAEELHYMMCEANAKNVAEMGLD